jgi:hypothetical protein
MSSPELDHAVRAERAMRRRLYELAEGQTWVHHTADLDSGELVTTPLDRPVTPLSRAERLSRLGTRFDATVFDGPSYRLTPRRPYQASPEAWLEVSKPNYYSATQVEWISWAPPRDLDIRSDFRGMLFSFVGLLLERRALASLSLSGHSFADTVGHILLTAPFPRREVTIPIGSDFGAHTVDFLFVPRPDPDGVPSEVVMGLLGGIELLTFTAITVGVEPPVLDPGDFGPGG